MDKVQVGIISHKPGTMLARCLDSLVRHEAGIDYKLLIQTGPGSNAENWNLLVDRANCEYLCVMEDDTAALRPMWLASLVETMELHPGAAIVMPIETKDGLVPDLGFKQWCDKTSIVPATYGFCNLIRMGAGLRADEKLTYFVDVDLSNQALAAGWQCYCNGHVWMLHGSKDGRMSADPNIEVLQAIDRAYMESKWSSKKEDQGNEQRADPGRVQFQAER